MGSSVEESQAQTEWNVLRDEHDKGKQPDCSQPEAVSEGEDAMQDAATFSAAVAFTPGATELKRSREDYENDKLARRREIAALSEAYRSTEAVENSRQRAGVI